MCIIERKTMCRNWKLCSACCLAGHQYSIQGIHCRCFRTGGKILVSTVVGGEECHILFKFKYKTLFSSNKITRFVDSKDRDTTTVILAANKQTKPQSSVRCARQGLALAVRCSLPAPYSCRPFETWTIRFHFICVMYIIHGFHYTVHQG